MNSISIWRDSIVLRWDKEIPPEMAERYRRLPDSKKAAWNATEEVLKYWPHIGQYARWNEKFHAFLLSFSKQNLQRIYREFGKIPVTKGQDKIDALKLRVQEAARINAMAHHIKYDPIESLPKLYLKRPPLGDYQYRGAALLTYIPPTPLFADCGCLSGDTLIRYSRAKCSRVMSLADMYANQEKRRGDRREDVKTNIRAFKDTHIGLHPIQKIVQQGVKPVLKLTLADGKTLKATPDHEILTDSGWVEMKDLSKGDLVMVDKFVNPRTHHIHHRDGDHYNNDVRNLECLDAAKHIKLHAKGYGNFSHGQPEYSKVKSVRAAGEEMTYDIVCEEPYRNFVANGVVVHNCGKTYMALVSTENQILQGMIERGKTLIAGKLPTLDTGWMADVEKFTNLKATRLWLPPTSRRKEKLIELLNEPADLYIINHEGILVLQEELIAKKFQKVVIDESTVLKSYRGARQKKGGKIGQALVNVASSAKWRTVMSGTPAPNGADDLWGQFKFLDEDGLLLEPSFYDFRASFMKEIVYGKKENADGGKGPSTLSKWVVPKDAVPAINNLISPLAYRVKIRDHLKDLPDKTVITRLIPMSSAQSKHYKEMEDSLSTVINDEFVSAEIKLTQMLKLRQITGGFLIDQEENAHAIADNPKLSAMDDLLNEEIAREEKVVIYAQYRWEVRTLAERYKDHGVVTVYGDNTSAKNLENIKAFINDPSVRLVILHPKSMAHGVTFVVARYMIFYSISHSAEDDYQCVKRIERAGQKNAMFVYYLLAQSIAKKKSPTIDEKIFVSVQDKIHNQGVLIDQTSIDEALLLSA